MSIYEYKKKYKWLRVIFCAILYIKYNILSKKTILTKFSQFEILFISNIISDELHTNLYKMSSEL